MEGVSLLKRSNYDLVILEGINLKILFYSKSKQNLANKLIVQNEKIADTFEMGFKFRVIRYNCLNLKCLSYNTISYPRIF